MKKIDALMVMGILTGVMIMESFLPKICLALPWEGPLETVRDSLTGPVAKAVCIITVCITGVMIAMGEGGAAGRTMLQLICGIALALFAVTFISELGS